MKNIALIALILASCSSTKLAITSATSADGDSWPLCFKGCEMSVCVLICAPSLDTLDKQKAEFVAAHPKATVKMIAPKAQKVEQDASQ